MPRALVKPRVQAQVTLPDGKQLPLDFAPDTAEPGFFTARFEAAMPGQHKVAATVAADDKPAADVRIAFDVEKLTWEMDFFLKHFVEAYRGVVLPPAEREAIRAALIEIVEELAKAKV